jgi:hypothetical protein
VAVPFWSSSLAVARHLPHGRHQAGTATTSSTKPETTSSVDPAGEFADYYLRFGVGFADGRKATNLEQRHGLDEGPAPDPPVLRLVRWEGYDRLAWEVDVWVWGLPAPGPLAFVCEWPARGIPESRVEIDAGLVLEAAARAVPIWPDQTPP